MRNILTPSQVKRYLQNALDSNASLNELGSKLNSIKIGINWAVKNKYLEAKVFEEITEIITEFEKAHLIKPLQQKSIPTRLRQKIAEKANQFHFRSSIPTQLSQTNEPSRYLAALVLVIFTSVLAAGLYTRFFIKPSTPFAYPTSLTKGGRVLSFQGRLTDSLGNPITTSTNVQFKLYTGSSGGSPLYSTGSCSVTPDQDGIFNTLIGSSCGSEIDASVFTENATIYMGTTVGSDSEMTPRQQIANVGYAINAETLQGLPPGTNTSNIPYINKDGDMLINVSAPGIRSAYASANFNMTSALGINIQSASSGDITLNASESGTLLFKNSSHTSTFDANGDLKIGGGTFNNTSGNEDLYVTGNLEADGVIYGNGSGLTSIGQANVTADSLDFTELQDTLDLDGSLTLNQGTGTWTQNFTGTTGPALTYTSSGAVGTGNAAGIELNVSNASTSVPGFLLRYAGSSYGLRINDDGTTTDTSPFVVDASGQVGIGTTTPAQALDIAGANANLTFSSATGPHQILTGGSTNLALMPGGNVGIGTTAPGTKLTVSGGLAIGTTSASSTYLTKVAPDGGAIFEGNVGIGITNPSAPLDVTGDIYLSSGLSTFRTAVSDGTVEATKFCTGDGETNCVNDFSTLSGSANIWTDGGSYIYTTNGEVLGNSASAGSNKIAGLYLADSSPLYFGTDNDVNFSFSGSTLAVSQGANNWTQTFTGTTGPGYTYTASGAVTQGNAAGVELNVSNASSSVPAMLIRNAGSSYALRINDDGTTTDTSPFVVDASGLVGIGTTTPAQALDIGGANSNLTFSSATGPHQILTGGSTNLALMPGGNVGIGFTSPGTKLTVSGGLAVGTTAASSTYLTKAAPDGGAIFEGSVGIGTTSPSAPLSVGASSQFQVSSVGAVTAVGVNSGSGLLQGTGGITVTGTGNINATGTSGTNIGNSTGTLALVGGASSTIDFSNFDVAATGNITVAAGQGLDTNASGALGLGNATATSINIGNTAATTINIGAGGNLTRTFNIGTGTGADTINIGIGVTTADDINLGGLSTTTIDVTGTVRAGDGGSTNYLNITSGGNLSFIGSASTIDKASGTLNINTTNNQAISTGTGTISLNGDTTIAAGKNLALASGVGTFTQTFTGTTGPAFTLTASGAVATGNAAGIELNVSNASTSVPAVMISNAGSSYALRVNDDGTTTDTSPFVIDASGQVGIGTTTPGQKLDVQGAVRLGANGNANDVLNTTSGSAPSGSLFWGNRTVCDSSGSCGSSVTGSGTANYLTKWATSSTISAGIMYDTGSAIGIGYTAPGTKLTVSGGLAVGTTAASSTYLTKAAPDGGAIFESSVGIGTTTPTSLFSVGSSSQFQVDTNGDIVKLKNLTYAWPSSHTTNGVLVNNGSGGLTWSTLGQSNITADSLDFTEFQDTLDLDGNLVLNQGTGTWSQTFTGTTGPGFSYVASGAITSGTAAAFSINVSNTSTSTPAVLITNNGTSNALIVHDDGTTTDTTPFIIDASGNVGVGTTTVTAGKLQVNGAIRTTDGTRGAVSYGFTSEGGDTGMYLVSDNNLAFATGNADVLFLASNGNVGIGTTNPSTAKLVVNGAIQGSNGSRSAVTYGFSSEGGDTGMYLSSDNNLAFATAATDRMFINSSGNVGIGTTTPAQALDIAGSTANLTFSSATGPHQILTGGTTNLALMPGGNVGIGTTSPGRTLDVVGNWGGNNYSESRTDTTNQTSTVSTKAIAYFLQNSKASGATPTTTTFNITGLPDTDGTFAFFSTKAANTGGDENTVAVQINGVQISSLSNTVAGTSTVTENYTVVRMNGTWRILGTGTSDSADVAEYFGSIDSSIGTGDIVAIDTNKEAERVVRDSGETYKAWIKKADKQNGKILGVISTNPAIKLADGLFRPDENPQPVALTGRVPVKVNLENGPIMIGDYLTLSSIPGEAMKQKDAGITIGRALNSYNGTQASHTVVVFVQTQFVDPGITLSSKGDLQLSNEIAKDTIYNGNLEEPSSNILDRNYALVDKSGQAVTNVISAGQGLFGKIKTGLLDAQNAVVKGTLVAANTITTTLQSTTVKTTSLIASSIKSDSVSVSEKIASPVIDTDNITVKETAKADKVETNVIKPQTNDLTIDLNITPTPSENGEAAGPLAKLLIKGREGRDVASIDAKGNASFSGTIAASQVQADSVVSSDISTDTLAVQSGRINSLEGAEASLSGKLVAKEVNAENIQKLASDVNSVQQLLASLQNQPVPNPSYYQNIPSDIDWTGNNITSTGNANLYNVSVTNVFTAGNIMIENNSILALASDLRLSSLSTITLFDNAVVIAKDGTITTQGTIIAKKGIKTNTIQAADPSKDVNVILGTAGSRIEETTKTRADNQKFAITNNLGVEVASVDASGSAHFNDIALNKYVDATSSATVIASAQNFAQNGIFAPAIETNMESAGVGVIPATEMEVIIYNKNISENSLIYLTPNQSIPNGQLSVVEKNTCKNSTDVACKPYFKISSGTMSDQDLKFNWLIIN